MTSADKFRGRVVIVNWINTQFLPRPAHRIFNNKTKKQETCHSPMSEWEYKISYVKTHNKSPSQTCRTDYSSSVIETTTNEKVNRIWEILKCNNNKIGRGKILNCDLYKMKSIWVKVRRNFIMKDRNCSKWVFIQTKLMNIHHGKDSNCKQLKKGKDGSEKSVEVHTNISLNI